MQIAAHYQVKNASSRSNISSSMRLHTWTTWSAQPAEEDPQVLGRVRLTDGPVETDLDPTGSQQTIYCTRNMAFVAKAVAQMG